MKTKQKFKQNVSKDNKLKKSSSLNKITKPKEDIKIDLTSQTFDKKNLIQSSSIDNLKCKLKEINYTLNESNYYIENNNNKYEDSIKTNDFLSLIKVYGNMNKFITNKSEEKESTPKDNMIVKQITTEYLNMKSSLEIKGMRIVELEEENNLLKMELKLYKAKLNNPIVNGNSDKKHKNSILESNFDKLFLATEEIYQDLFN